MRSSHMTHFEDPSVPESHRIVEERERAKPPKKSFFDDDDDGFFSDHDEDEAQ